MTNDDVYKMLIYFYLDEISDWRFERDMRTAGISERKYLSCYFASRILGETSFEKLMREIEEIEAKGQ